jgi:hypothetical protein
VDLTGVAAAFMGAVVGALALVAAAFEEARPPLAEAIRVVVIAHLPVLAGPMQVRVTISPIPMAVR